MLGCLAPGVFICRSDAECVKEEAQGTCIRSSCAFADANCPSRIRWDVTAQSEAGDCLCSPYPCPSPAHATATCVKGACRIASCDTGYQDCDGQHDNGCEANVANSDMQLDAWIDHCGACGAGCSRPAHASGVSCQASACKIFQCDNGFGDCDGQYANGCEASLADSDGQRDTEIDHCGACGMRCPRTIGVNFTACQASACAIDQCIVYYADCDKQYANGCEGRKGAYTSCNNSWECKSCACRYQFGEYLCSP